MGSKNVSIVGLLPWIAMGLVFLGSTKGDINKDREQCGEQLIGLATCLPYVGGQAKLPPMDCCNGLKQVLTKSKVCLCILIKDRDDPSLGLKINATLALGLPDSCHAPANVTDCPRLMNLPPNSPDAKIFEDYAKSIKGNNNTLASPGNATKGNIGSSGEIRSNEAIGIKWLGVDKVYGLLLFMIIVVMLQHPYL